MILCISTDDWVQLHSFFVSLNVNWLLFCDPINRTSATITDDDVKERFTGVLQISLEKDCNQRSKERHHHSNNCAFLPANPVTNVSLEDSYSRLGLPNTSKENTSREKWHLKSFRYLVFTFCWFKEKKVYCTVRFGTSRNPNQTFLLFSLLSPIYENWPKSSVYSIVSF